MKWLVESITYWSKVTIKQDSRHNCRNGDVSPLLNTHRVMRESFQYRCKIKAEYLTDKGGSGLWTSGSDSRIQRGRLINFVLMPALNTVAMCEPQVHLQDHCGHQLWFNTLISSKQWKQKKKIWERNPLICTKKQHCISFSKFYFDIQVSWWCCQ